MELYTVIYIFWGSCEVETVDCALHVVAAQVQTCYIK